MKKRQEQTLETLEQDRSRLDKSYYASVDRYKNTPCKEFLDLLVHDMTMLNIKDTQIAHFKTAEREKAIKKTESPLDPTSEFEGERSFYVERLNELLKLQVIK